MKIGEYTVIQNPHMLDRIFTKKQTRKLKNRRWVKKYENKHSYMVPKKDFLFSERTKVIFVHPATYRQLELELAKENGPKIPNIESQRMSFMPTYSFGVFTNTGLILSNCSS